MSKWTKIGIALVASIIIGTILLLFSVNVTMSIICSVILGILYIALIVVWVLYMKENKKSNTISKKTTDEINHMMSKE